MGTLSKILLVGAFAQDPSIYTYASSFQPALQKLGYQTHTFNYRAKGFSTPITALNQLLCNKALLRTAATLRPDLVFLIKVETIWASTLAHIKKNLSCKLINFYPDNPFALWNGNSNAEVLKSLPHYDCFLSWSSVNVPVLMAAGCKHSCLMPFAYDEDLFALSKQEITIDPVYQSDVCFVGTWEPDREQWLAALITHLPQCNLAIWGNEWDKQCHNRQLLAYVRGKALYKHEMIKAFATAKIVLNFIRRQNMMAHNMRTFEVTASKAFLLTERTDQQCKIFFTEGENIECFGNLDELADKITFYLQHEQERLAIAHRSFQQAQNFSLTKQLQHFFQTCPSLSFQGHCS